MMKGGEKMKNIAIALLLTVAALICLTAIAVAGTSGSGAVAFTVLPTQSLTANAINLGNVSSGTNNSTATPVTVSSNTAWDVTAQADGNFTGGSQIISAGNLSLNGQALSTSGSALILDAQAAGAVQSPVVATSLVVPWAIDPGAGLLFSGSVTYTVAPN